ncbi:tektin-4 [Carcharodon carcharias]|uniref:tektin-4 n=1 Tax=Carcharodon carcharias TaxID=13397 RepID=UPI001B7F5B1F|nr:tektin-4 [Carcharodon carcharias]
MSAAEVLVTHPQVAQCIPEEELPCKPYCMIRNEGLHSSAGLPTAGFRTAKYIPEEWAQNNYAKYYQAFADRDTAENVQNESKTLMSERERLTQDTQATSTKKIGERLQDIFFWKSELKREIEDLLAETELLLQQKRRLEIALDAVEIAMFVSTDNLQNRERRQGPDLVKDRVEDELLKEVDLIRNVQGVLKRTLDEVIKQIRRNRDAKEVLEMDWSDKYEAYKIDVKAGGLNNQSTNIQFHPNSAKFEDNSSTPESWAQFTHCNIYKAEQERMASINLRALVDNVLLETSQDLRCQYDRVNAAFNQRLEELNDAKAKLEYHLRRILEQIADQEKNIAHLKQAIKDKEAPLKVAQTRLYERTYRPNVELTRDPAQFNLICEVSEIQESISLLQEKLREAQISLENMENTRMTLEKEIAIKVNSIFIDSEKCLKHRERYPSIIRLSGYQ